MVAVLAFLVTVTTFAVANKDGPSFTKGNLDTPVLVLTSNTIAADVIITENTWTLAASTGTQQQATNITTGNLNAKMLMPYTEAQWQISLNSSLNSFYFTDNGATGGVVQQVIWSTSVVNVNSQAGHSSILSSTLRDNGLTPNGPIMVWKKPIKVTAMSFVYAKPDVMSPIAQNNSSTSLNEEESQKNNG